MIFKRFRKQILATVAGALLSTVLVTATLAQGGKGTIKGHVTDPSGGVLQGAQVTLEPRTQTLASDVLGEFFIRDLEPGSYTVTVSYVGFKATTKTIDVVAGQVANVEAKLDVEDQNQQVLVVAERASAEAEAVNRERTADNIVQVLPADVIRSLPNANMADALGRLPSVTLERDEGEGKYVQIRGTEPRLTNTTVDGVNVPSPESGVRQIKFDSIPADLVESVEISKTLQANMDGDGIGGSINLVTKTAGERPTIALSGMGGYMPILGGRTQYESAGTIGQRFGKDKRFGLLVGGTYDWSGRGIDDIEPVSDIATFANTATTVLAGVWLGARTTNSAKDRTSMLAGSTPTSRTTATAGSTPSLIIRRTSAYSARTVAAPASLGLIPRIGVRTLRSPAS